MVYAQMLVVLVDWCYGSVITLIFDAQTQDGCYAWDCFWGAVAWSAWDAVREEQVER
jgi:hypothetical protein